MSKSYRKLYIKTLPSYSRFSLLRKVMDAEMKESTKKGFGLKNTKPQREPVTAEEEEILWSKGLLGGNSATSLLHTIYFYNGKLFGLRAKDHRNLRIANFRITDNMITFDESFSKTFHGGLKDLKNTPRVSTHFCHDSGKEHPRCLVQLYKLYLEKIKIFDSVVQDKAFYFYPNRDFSKFEFEQRPLGENKLNGILPDELCAKAGLARKTAHSLRITTATRLFQSGIEEKLIRDRTGHKSDSLFKYERVSNQQLKQASSILGPCNSEANDSTNYPSFEFNLFDTLEDNFFDNVISDETLCSINLSDDDLMFNEDVADEILAGIDYESATTSVTRPTPKVSEACTASPPKLVFSNCTFTNVTFTRVVFINP